MAKKERIKKLVEEVTEMFINTFVDIYEFVEEKKKKYILPTDVKQGALHKVLGIPEDKNITDYDVDTLVQKARAAINSGKATKKGVMGKLVWAYVMNRHKNPSVASKLKAVINRLKEKKD